jgi:hypothetical protein
MITGLRTLRQHSVNENLNFEKDMKVNAKAKKTKIRSESRAYSGRELAGRGDTTFRCGCGVQGWLDSGKVQ